MCGGGGGVPVTHTNYVYLETYVIKNFAWISTFADKDQTL